MSQQFQQLLVVEAQPGRTLSSKLSPNPKFLLFLLDWNKTIENIIMFNRVITILTLIPNWFHPESGLLSCQTGSFWCLVHESQYRDEDELKF